MAFHDNALRSDRAGRWRRRGRGLAGAAFVLGLGAAGFVIGEGSAYAQVRQLVPRGAGAPLSPVRVDSGRVAGEVVVPVGKSQVLRIDQAFEEVSVGNPEIADVVPLTQRSVYVFGRQLGTTNVTFIGQGGEPIAVVDLVVSYDIAGLRSRLFEVVPEETIEVRAAGNRVLLSGRVSSSSELARVLAIAESFAPERVTNLLTVGGSQQVMLEVRFAEVARSVVKQLGLNSFFFEGGSTSFAFESGTRNPDAFAAGLLSLFKGDYQLDFLFDTLEEKGVVKTLAEPTLIALSGDTASFLAGGEFPIPVATDEEDGGIDIIIAFKEFGVSLAFTPTVLGDDLVNLVVAAEVSSIDPTISVNFESLVIPGLDVRRARTTVELRDGQSFAIAGLLQDDFQDQVRQVPILGDIPVLGALLRSTQFQTNQSELVVVVTPRLVEPVPAGSLVTPADTFSPPTQPELFLLGRTEGLPEVAADAEAAEIEPTPADALNMGNAGGIDGPYGYILR